jgi:hypothetical protein
MNLLYGLVEIDIPHLPMLSTEYKVAKHHFRTIIF